MPEPLSLGAPLMRERAAEAVNAFEAFFDAGHAGGVAEPEAVVGTKSDARDGGDFLGFEQARAEIGGGKAGFTDVREEVEGALGIHTGDTRNGIEFLPGVSPTPIELGDPSLEMILRTGERGHRSLLGEGSRIAGAVALNGIDGFGDRFGRGEETKPPAGHAPGFGKAMNDNRMVV